jgi:hypothetical protein
MSGKLTSINESLLAHYGELRWWTTEERCRELPKCEG